jgi:hypothetical protein
MRQSVTLMITSIALELCLTQFAIGQTNARFPMVGNWVDLSTNEPMTITAKPSPVDITKFDLFFNSPAWGGASFAPDAAGGGNLVVNPVTGPKCNYTANLAPGNQRLYLAPRAQGCRAITYDRVQ